MALISGRRQVKAIVKTNESHHPMDHLDYLADLQGHLRLERVPDALEMALDEYKQCLRHDEETPVPPGLSEEIRDRLAHGRDLALARRKVISDAMGQALSHLPIRELPKEFQKFHPEYMTTIAPEEIDATFKDWGFDADQSR